MLYSAGKSSVFCKAKILGRDPLPVEANRDVLGDRHSYGEFRVGLPPHGNRQIVIKFSRQKDF